MGTTCSSMTSSRGGVAELIAAGSCGDTKTCLEILKDRPDFVYRSPLTGVGNTVMHVAVAHLDCLEAIINFTQIEAEAVASTSKGQLCRVQQRLSRVLDITNNHGQTPLMLACRGGYPEAVRLLLIKGADPWMVDKLGHRTALHHAALAGQAVCIKALLTTVRKTARYIDIRTVCGFSPLHCAIAVRSVEAVRALLHYSPNVYACNVFPPPHFRIRCPTQTTVLHMAAIAGDRQIVLELLKYYVERSAVVTMNDPRRLQDGDHRLPYQVADLRGHHHIVQLLHPSQRLLGEVFRPEQLKIMAGIPTLSMLAASALRTRLMASLDRLAHDAATSAGTSGATPAHDADTEKDAVGMPPLSEAVCPPNPAVPSRAPTSQPITIARNAMAAALDRESSTGVPASPDSATAGATAGGSPALSSSWPSCQVPGLPRTSVPPISLSRTSAAAAPSSLSRTSAAAIPRRASLEMLAAAFEENEDELADAMAEAEAEAGGPSRCAAPSKCRNGANGEGGEMDEEFAAVAMPRGEGGCAETCGICLDQHQSIAVEGCRHRMCRRCARSLARQVHYRVSPCPFCRGPIGDFVAM